MSTHIKILVIIFLTTILACNNQPQNKKMILLVNKSECLPYFTYDEVEHFYFDISENEIWKVEAKDKKNAKEKKQIALLIQSLPEKLTDTIALNGMEKIGYRKHDVPKNKFEELNQIFCEREHNEGVFFSCAAVYRDILIFKKNNKIIGTAKICFECNQNIITGTLRNAVNFGQSGDYEKLYKLLH